MKPQLVRVSLVAIVAVLTATRCLAQVPSDGGVEYQLRRAERLMDQLNFPFAIRHLEKVGKSYPKDGRVDVLRGECHFALDQWPEAVGAYRAGLKKTPGIETRLPNYPFALLKLDELDAAQEGYEKIFAAASDDSQRAQASYGLGLVSLHRGETDKAIESLARAYSFNPRSSKINYRLGLAYRKAKKPDLALKHLEKVMERNGLHEAAAYNVAMAWLQKGDRAQVKEWKKRHREIRRARLRLGGLRAQLVKRPGDLLVLRNIAELQSRFGNFDEAIGPWRAVTAGNATDPRARYEYARCLFHTGDYLKARQQLDQVLARKPDFEAAKTLHATIMKEFHGEKAAPETPPASPTKPSKS